MTSPNKEEQLRRILYEYQLMENSVQIFQQRFQVLTSASSDLQISQQTLQDMKNLPNNNPILIPIGGGTFVQGKTGDLSIVVVGIGADISVEMKIEDALKEINNRLRDNIIIGLPSWLFKCDNNDINLIFKIKEKNLGAKTLGNGLNISLNDNT